MRKIAIALALISLIFVLPVILDKTGFFVVNKPVLSNKLIIEGWLNPNELDEPPFLYNDYDTIFVVGIKTPARWNKVREIRNENDTTFKKSVFGFPQKGFLFLKGYQNKNISDTINNIKVIARGTKARGRYAHFCLSVKDSLLGSSFVNANRDTFTFKVKLHLNQLDFLNVYFDNDFVTATEDINMSVYEILIDNVSFVPSNNEFFYLETDRFGIINSNAQRTANYLSTIGNINAKIIVIDTLYDHRNKTLAAACSFANYLKAKNVHLTSVNVYTVDFHSRRTNLAYRRALHSKIKVGSIVKYHSDVNPSRRKAFKHWYYLICDEFGSWLGTLFSFR